MRPWLKAMLMLAVVVVAAFGFLLWHLHPEEQAWMPQCPLWKYGGLYCSGCGSLRAMHYLLNGNLSAAWNMNPLIVLMLPGIAYLAVAALFFRTHRPALQIRPFWIWALLATVILFVVLRNIPFYPFTLLAPH